MRRLRSMGSLSQNTISLNRRSLDRKSTRLNSSHLVISYAVFCLKKKERNKEPGTDGRQVFQGRVDAGGPRGRAHRRGQHVTAPGPGADEPADEADGSPASGRARA